MSLARIVRLRVDDLRKDAQKLMAARGSIAREKLATLLGFLRDLYRQIPDGFDSYSLSNFKHAAAHLESLKVDPGPRVVGNGFEVGREYTVDARTFRVTGVSPLETEPKFFPTRLARDYERYLWQRLLDGHKPTKFDRWAEAFVPPTDASEWLEATRIAYQSDVRQRHRQFLFEKGLSPVDAIRTPHAPRKAHCFRCAVELDGAVELECPLCAWMVCECGACGCSYHGRDAAGSS